MAVKSPLMPSPNGGLVSAFSPYSDSPSSPAYHGALHSSVHLQPQNPKSPSSMTSPSDASNPSPIASSIGTDGTYIDEATMDDTAEATAEERGQRQMAGNIVPEPAVVTVVNVPEADVENGLNITTTDSLRNDAKGASSDEEEPPSVIQAPKDFKAFHAIKTPPADRRPTPTPSQRSDITIVSPTEPTQRPTALNSPLSPPPISTSVEPVRDFSATPRAQTMQEAQALQSGQETKIESPNLGDIPEVQSSEEEGAPAPNHTLLEDNFRQSISEVAALRLALRECWTLCNTLAELSHLHRERSFRQTGDTDGREQAWRSCWKLCQRLYDNHDTKHAIAIGSTLSLCREFCQSIFDVRQRGDEVADSVLRVSFELNNHLYNTHDRALPEAFRERTLDFYITLCHRLMKQHTRLGAETDSLLRACWSLAEMLFSLRQNKRDDKPDDEELLGSAVQACWELCDLFREGWTQVRPDRGTPRPSQPTFTQAFQQAKRGEKAKMITIPDSEDEDDDVSRLHPETPTTIFEDTQQVSPDDDVHVPNILVLGPDASTERFPQWSSSASSRSGFSQASSGHTTSSTSTIINPSEDPRLSCLKLLLVKAALNTGFKRGSPHNSGSSGTTGPSGTSTAAAAKLDAFVKSLPSNSFGTAPWQMQVLEHYRKLVASDPAFRNAGSPRRASAVDVARAVKWMARSGQYSWLKDLYRLVCGFRVEEAEDTQGVFIQS